MTRSVFVSAPYFIAALDRFRQRFDDAGIRLSVVPVRERLDEAALLDLIGGVDGVICGDDEFSERVLRKAAPRLKVISKWGTGIDSIDVEAACRLGVKVCNTPGAFTDPVADTTLGYVLAINRRLQEMSASVHQGAWDKVQLRSLREMTLGIVGVGRIGGAVASRACAFGMRVLGTDIRPVAPEVARTTGLRQVPLDELLSTSDIVSLHCDLNPSSRHLLNPERIALMTRTALLINTSRGSVVEEPALVEALRDGRLAAAALDVFEVEPLPLDSPLSTMTQVWLAPHNANSSGAAWERVHESTIRNLFDGLGLTSPW
jgi:D-3-phosphoglycerate dehydrogenase